MEIVEKIRGDYSKIFRDKISIKLLYQQKEEIDSFVDKNNNIVCESTVADWIMEKYYNDRKLMEYCKDGKRRISGTEEKIYH